MFYRHSSLKLFLVDKYFSGALSHIFQDGIYLKAVVYVSSKKLLPKTR